MKSLLSGNEAVARGAWEAGCIVATAYPGTPSTEILQNISKYPEINSEWSVNEKVAFETALAASICGLKSMVSMKHVGVNVAHDPLMTASYMGVRGGFVLLSADDPHCWSSQNEQDNRHIAEQAFVPVLEPSSIQEAKDIMADAFNLSEEFGQIFMVRSVTRISHGRSDVTLGKITKERREGSFEKNRTWLVFTPVEARLNKALMLQRFEKISEAVNTFPYNQLKLSDGARLGIIACGLSYSYTQEALNWLGLGDRVSVLKIGTPHPLPQKLVKQLLSSVEEVLVVEELDPFVETHVKAIAQEANIQVEIHGKELVPRSGELSTRKVVEAITSLTGSKLPIDFDGLDKLGQEISSLLPLRPPTLCPGCPHRASHYAIKVAAQRVVRDYGKDVEPIYPGDIGCYDLAYNPPLEAVDTTICMGASFGIANGLAHIINAPIVAHIGDSTFFHSGIPPMINAVYNGTKITMVVMDNSATAMTGFQPHPGTGLVDHVDGLIGQATAGDVPHGKLHGLEQGLVRETDTVMRLIAVLQPAQDLHSLVLGGRIHQDGLETTFQGPVLLDVLAILVERRRADRLQLAAGQHRLEDRRGIDRTLGGAGADQGVDLVDEQDDVTAGLDLLEDLLEAFLEVTAVARPRDQCRGRGCRAACP